MSNPGQKLLLLAGAVATMLTAHGASVTFSFQENGSNVDLGTSSTFTEGTSSITASGFDTSGNPAHLFAKFTGSDPTETGLGMVDDPENEINPTNFIQLDFSNVRPTSSSILAVSSVQPGESAVVYATKTPGSLAGATLITTLTANDSVDVTSYVNAGDFIDITAGAVNVLLRTLTIDLCDLTCAVAPAEADICAGDTQTFKATASGGTPPYTFAWDTGATGDSITVGAAGTYTATVTDAKGCSSTCSATLKVEPLPECSLTAPDALPACGSANNTLSGPPGLEQYLWSIISSTAPGWAITSGSDQQTVTYTAGSTGTATFQLVVENAAGCPATCQVTIGCATAQAGCRVTGGSNKEFNTFQGSCVQTKVPTFVSHGGQVGASHAGETEFTPYSPCISGEWQHDRHLTQKSLVGSLHAAGNGATHQFDSLLCACLPCDATLSAVGVVGEVCNPNDRDCGPLPRRAPANKICFSGVGDYTPTTGPKTVKAVFRVDIEDRSEGNSQASNRPPDRYRIRIWLLNTNCRPFGPDSAQGLALRFAVSADASKIASLATTELLRNPVVAGAPDIDDGGDMTQGNHQIHPNTGSSCP